MLKELMSEPRISVITANYNHAQLLPRCLSALLSQSVQPWEIIVVDDASTDNSLEVINSFAKQHPLIRVYSNERNLGVNLNNNRGLELARGDYVFFAAADDEVKPGFFEKSIRMLRDHPEAGLSSGICEWRAAGEDLSWYIGAAMPGKPCFLSPSDMVALGRRGRLAISAPCSIFKKTALVEAGGWIPELRWFTDFFGAHVVGFRHGMCHVPEVLSTFNLSPNSYYQTANSRAERGEVMERVLLLLESPKYADVEPFIRKSGILGAFGWPMVQVVTGRKLHWRFLSVAFIFRAARRCAEVVGRRFFPDRLARFCLKVFYGRRSRGSA